jgi:GWxTD domain-containing protein
MTRFAAPGFFNSALDVARKGSDSLQHANAALEAGRVHWRRYDALAHRRMETRPGAAIRSVSQAVQNRTAAPDNGLGDGGDPPQASLKDIIEAVELSSMALPLEVTGGHDLETASALFREAYAQAPNNPRTFRAVAMTIVDQEKWADLDLFARTHLKSIPWDPWGWMALGLATHREGKDAQASAAYDSALTQFSPEERARLDRLDRVLPGSDSARRARGAAPTSASISQLYWTMADPLWSRGGNESRNEFLSRVTYSEFRWSVDELNIRGVDTDRGDIFVRYGPPDVIAAFGPVVSSETYGIDEMNVSTTWIYRKGLVFVFNGMATYATSHIATSDVAMVTAFKEALPVRWDNLTSLRVDSMQTQIARFRGGHDSVDVIMAFDPSVETIRAAQAAPAPIRADMWFLTDRMANAARDSIALDSSGVRSWIRRLAPGVYVARAEASSDGGPRASRSTNVFEAGTPSPGGLLLHGFAISDVLLGSSAEPKNGADKRWTDLAIIPAVGTSEQASQLALVWENYEFGNENGSAHYDVTVTITRGRSIAGQISATVVGALAGIAHIDRTQDHVAVTFERTVPYAPAFADHFTISLAQSPPGPYTLLLTVTDRATGQTATRSKAFRIKK